MLNSFTSSYSEDQKSWIRNERYARMRNDEDYSIDHRVINRVNVHQCDECKEVFEGSPFMVRGDGIFNICFCGTTCCSDWMRRHGQ